MHRRRATGIALLVVLAFCSVLALAVPANAARAKVAAGSPGSGRAVVGQPPAHSDGAAPRRSPAPFRAEQLPVPAGALKDHAGYGGPIACPKVGGCVVLGEYPTASGESEDFIATESAGTWSSVRAPVPPGGVEAANLGPFTLGCTGVGDCLGTSLYVTASSVLPELLEELKGHWSARPMPLPANADRTRIPTVAAMSCPGLGDCVLVGTYVTTRGLSEPFVVSQKGSSLFVAAEAPLPAPSDGSGSLSGIGCTAVGACVAVGYVVGRAGLREPLAVTDAAGSLSAATLALPAGAAANPLAELDGVSCGRSSDCVALGSYLGHAGGRLGVIETEASGKWTTAGMPSPKGASATSPSPRIASVVCKVGNYCMAVGRYSDASNTPQALALLDQSGHWSASVLPGTLGTGADVTAVSCVSDTSCAAVGHYTPVTARSGYVVLRSGSSLSGGAAPRPAGASATASEDLDYVSCPWIATCTASGTFESPANPAVVLPLVVGN